jgi:hypothetical protein
MRQNLFKETKKKLINKKKSYETLKPNIYKMEREEIFCSIQREKP